MHDRSETLEVQYRAMRTVADPGNYLQAAGERTKRSPEWTRVSVKYAPLHRKPAYFVTAISVLYSYIYMYLFIYETFAVSIMTIQYALYICLRLSRPLLLFPRYTCDSSRYQKSHFDCNVWLTK